jgi:carbamoyl-phosphate synthase large subunit
LSETVLLTGAGGAALPFLIRHLRAQGYRVLAADMDPTAAGLRLADRGYVIPGGASDAFPAALAEIIAHESVDVFVPLVDEELVPALSLQEQGVRVLLPRSEFTALCLDKYRFATEFERSGLPVPRTRLASDGTGDLRFPLIVKPRVGRGSRGVALAGGPGELEECLGRSSYRRDELLLQEFIAGTEFTVSVVVWRDGEVQAVVPKEVISKRGITRIAVTRRHPGVDEVCRRIQAELSADGPFNVQLRLDPATGRPFVFEVNPRFSTTVSLTIAAGIDEIGGLVKQALHGRTAHEFGEWKEGLVMLRQTLDEFVDESAYCAQSVERWEVGS